MKRLTHERVNGIKTGYWSAATEPRERERDKDRDQNGRVHRRGL